VLLCVNRTSLFLFLLKSMGIAWLADVKSYFSFYFKRPSVHDIYDIGTRLSTNNAMSLHYCVAGEHLCSNARTDAARTSSVVRSCRDKAVVSAIAGTDSKIAFTVRKIVINALSCLRLYSTGMRRLHYLNRLAVQTPGWANPMFGILKEAQDFMPGQQPIEELSL
jgi:hypothetical protein